jgi:hypothetical protein
MTQDRALSILKTGANVFLTGEPGAGKTYTINAFVNYMRDAGVEVAITASTGIAATHIGGMTIHSWSGIGIKTNLTKYDIDRIASNEYVVKRIRRAKVLVIDEISMLSHSMLSSVDAVIREVKQNPEPFGGMQVIFVGDFFQLPPIVRLDKPIAGKGEGEYSQELFDNSLREPLFAYESPAWRAANPIVCYISEQHRQDDENFFALLSAIRGNNFDQMHLEILQDREKEFANAPENAPKLFSHNVDVDRINTDMLRKIDSTEKKFTMTSMGRDVLVAILKKGCLSPEELILKVGAEVMFTKNNPKEGFVNGTLGTVVDFDKAEGNPIVKIKDGRNIKVVAMDWTMEENGKIRAQISQLPLRHAWAITVHKSQGMSMDSAVMDLSQVFEYGQGYVALSRVRRLSGLYIKGWNQRALEVHPAVLEQDSIFKNKSAEAEDGFGDIPVEDLEKMHVNFITASGGKIKKAKKEKSNKKSNKEIDKIEAGSYKEKLAKLREKYPNAYMPWNDELDVQLTEQYKGGKEVKELVKHFGRQNGSIRARLIKLGLIEE